METGRVTSSRLQVPRIYCRGGSGTARTRVWEGRRRNKTVTGFRLQGLIIGGVTGRMLHVACCKD